MQKQILQNIINSKHIFDVDHRPKNSWHLIRRRLQRIPLGTMRDHGHDSQSLFANPIAQSVQRRRWRVSLSLLEAQVSGRFPGLKLRSRATLMYGMHGMHGRLPTDRTWFWLLWIQPSLPGRFAFERRTTVRNE